MPSVRKIVLGVVGVGVVAVVAIQFVPVAARTNPPVESQIQWNSPETEQLVRAACYGCCWRIDVG